MNWELENEVGEWGRLVREGQMFIKIVMFVEPKIITMQKLFTLLCASFLLATVSIKAQTITSSNLIDNGIYVQGVYVPNNLIVEPISGADQVVFYASDDTYQTNYEIGTDDYSDGVFSLDSLNMGGLTPDLTRIWVEYFDDTQSFIDNSSNFTFTIRPSPAWLLGDTNGTAITNSISGDGSILYISAAIPVRAILTSGNTLDPTWKGIGGKKFQFDNVNLIFDIEYDISDGSSITTNAGLQLDMFSLTGNTNSISSADSTFNAQIQFDEFFNPFLTASLEFEPEGWSKYIPLANVSIAGVNSGAFSLGGLCINVDLQIDLEPKIRGDVVIGLDQTNNEWGFIEANGNITGIKGKVEATSTLKGEIKTVCLSAFGKGKSWGTLARGEVTVSLIIGGGVTYHSFTSPNLTPLFGAEFSLEAVGQVLGGKERRAEYNPDPWGDISVISFKVDSVFDDFFHFSSATGIVDTAVVPQAWPMGKLSARDSILSIVWLDDINDTIDGKTSLLITYYDPLTNSFTYPSVIIENDKLITTPAHCLLPNGESIVAWTQSESFFGFQIDSNTVVDEVLRSQNVWVAVYGFDTTMIYMVEDNNELPESEPAIFWGNQEQGMLTWLGGDELNEGNDIYYSVISENDNGYTFSDAEPLTTNQYGSNEQLHISYFGDNEAMAEWIFDPDNNDETANSVIMFTVWDGSNWETPIERYEIPEGMVVNDISMAVTDTFGLEAFTFNYYLEDSSMSSAIYLEWWNGGDPSTSQGVILYDSLSYLQIPKVSISQNGIASLTLQVIDKTEPSNEGQLNMFLKDLNSGLVSDWQNIAATNSEYLQFLSDENQFVWEMSSAFGFYNGQGSSSHDIIYLLTQETNTEEMTNPTFGEVFGNENLNMVLRTVKVENNNGDFTIDNIDEPDLTSIKEYYSDKGLIKSDFDFFQNYPNPFSDYTNISFRISKPGIVKLEVFDISGRYIATLLEKDLLVAANYETKFYPGDITNGIYFLKLSYNDKFATRKMIIAK